MGGVCWVHPVIRMKDWVLCDGRSGHCSAHERPCSPISLWSSNIISGCYIFFRKKNLLDGSKHWVSGGWALFGSGSTLGWTRRDLWMIFFNFIVPFFLIRVHARILNRPLRFFKPVLFSFPPSHSPSPLQRSTHYHNSSVVNPVRVTSPLSNQRPFWTTQRSQRN